jgi:DNA-binding PadR family transcriptional regulator
MSLRHAILTALLEKPCSGLELTRRFDKSIGFFWPARHQQVYSELSKLEADQLIESSTPQPLTRGAPKRYVVLPAGRRELANWVSKPEGPRPVRDAVSVRLRAAAVVGPGSLVEELKQHQLHHEARRALYLDIQARDFSDRELTPQQQIYEVILHGGIAHEEFRLRFIGEALDVLSRIDSAMLPTSHSDS